MNEQHLRTAVVVIREAPGRIAELRARRAPAEQIAAEEELLRNAEDVRKTLTLQALRETAEAKAGDLLVLDARRRELVAALHTYRDASVSIGGQACTTQESRRVNAALVLGLEPPDTGAFDDARRGWQIEADSLLSGPGEAPAKLLEAIRG